MKKSGEKRKEIGGEKRKTEIDAEVIYATVACGKGKKRQKGIKFRKRSWDNRRDTGIQST